MYITVKAQNVHTHKKNIRRDDLKGLTCFIQMGSSVCVTASLDHQAIVRDKLGEPDTFEFEKLPSYWGWYDVEAAKLVDVLYAIATEPARKGV